MPPCPLSQGKDRNTDQCQVERKPQTRPLISHTRAGVATAVPPALPLSDLAGRVCRRRLSLSVTLRQYGGFIGQHGAESDTICPLVHELIFAIGLFDQPVWEAMTGCSPKPPWRARALACHALVAVADLGVNAFPSVHPCLAPPPSFLGCKRMIQGPCQLQQYCSALHELISERRAGKEKEKIERLWCISANITGCGPSRRELDKYSSPSTTRAGKVWAERHTTVQATPSHSASDYSTKATEIQKDSTYRNFDDRTEVARPRRERFRTCLGCRSALSGVAVSQLDSFPLEYLASFAGWLVSAYTTTKQVHS